MQIFPAKGDLKGLKRLAGLATLMCALTASIHIYSYRTIDPEHIRPVQQYASSSEVPEDICAYPYERAIESIDTPQQAQRYLWSCMTTKIPSPHETFRKNHEDGAGECWDYATSAAALLSDDGYPAYILTMRKETEPVGHAVFIYKDEKGFRALGNTPVQQAYDSIEGIVRHINRVEGRAYDTRMVIDLGRTYPDGSWIGNHSDTPPLRLKPYLWKGDSIE